jgi:hypothetical protein
MPYRDAAILGEALDARKKPGIIEGLKIAFAAAHSIAALTCQDAAIAFR